MKTSPEIYLGFQIQNQKGRWGKESGVVKSTSILVF